MQFFDYSYVITMVLALAFLMTALLGLLFTLKSVRVARGMAEKSFLSLGKLENVFEKAGDRKQARCVVYIYVSFDVLKRLYSASKAARMHERITHIVFDRFCTAVNGELSVYDEENFVAVNSLQEEDVIHCMEQCLAEINDTLERHGAVGTLHVKFGYYLTAATDVSFKTALTRAKQACSMADDQNVLYCHWDSSNGKAFERKIKIENNIQREIENNRFFLEYQPILDAKTGGMVGAEVLSRLNSETEGILTPRAFLAAVDSVGLHQDFDYYIFDKNCKWIANDKENRMKYLYTINFSRYTLCDPHLAERIIQTVEQYGIDYACIAVEILEDKNLEGEDKDAMVQNIIALKEKGILIFLDDFGKGYAGFCDLIDLNIDIVKIDKSITQSAIGHAGFLILKNIIKTAHELGFKALCEGIETEEHKRVAVEAGCDILQGYYLHRPMSVARFEALFDT